MVNGQQLRVALLIAVLFPVSGLVVWRLAGIRDAGVLEEAGGPECQPWTRCASAQWLKERLLSSDYQIVGDTGSAFVVKGDSTFYAWTTSAGSLPADGGYQEIGSVANTKVYGDGVRLTWEARHQIIWIAGGPANPKEIPSVGQLENLVKATGSSVTG